MDTDGHPLIWANTEERITVKDVCGNVPPGWHALVREAIGHLFNLGWNGRVAQVKETLFALVIYVERGSPEISKYLWRLRERSYGICELRGGKRELRAVTGQADPELFYPCCAAGHCAPTRRADATFIDEQLDGADFSGSDLRTARFHGTSFSQANLENANLAGQHLAACKFRRARMAGVNLQRAYIATLYRDAIRSVSFRAADLTLARMAHVQAHKTDFREANLFRADCEYADFVDADFRGACLKQANLRHADVRLARFDIASRERSE